MDANEDYLDSLLNSVMSQDSGDADGGLGNEQQNNSSEAELKEINDVLEKSDQNQMPDEEILAMLERAGSEMPAEASDNDVPDVFDIFSSESVGLEEDYANASVPGNSVPNGTAADDLADENGQTDSGDDFLSLDSLQTEEEPAPVEESFGEDDFLSLDSLQTEEEPPSKDELQSENDMLSLDSLQSDEDMSFGGAEGEEDTIYGADAEEDDEIQREIDELLGLTGISEEEDSVQNESVPDSIPANAVSSGEEASNSKEEKKKKKKAFGKKKAKETDEPAQSESQENVANDFSESAVGDGIMTEDTLSSGAQATEMTEGKKKAKRKKEKAEKQKNAGNPEEEQKEPGFFARMLNALFEEEDDEEDAQSQELAVSDENREIMAMMANEKIENKKPGSKKAKKGKADAKQGADGEDDEEVPVDKKKAKKEQKKKAKKEKQAQKEKEKQEKAQEEAAVPKKKLPRGKVFAIFAFCLTLLAVILILCFVIPAQRDLKTAREAYYDRDYLTVYQNMDGKDLNDSDYILYMRSKMILSMQGKLDNYLIYLGMDKEMAALNELMLAVHYYQSNRSLAESYGALDEMNTVYEQVLSVLSQQYRLSETDAIEIFALDDLSYNEELYYLVHGTAFVAPNMPQGGSSNAVGGFGTGGTGNDPMDDILPEEDEMFGENQPQENVNSMPEYDSDTEITNPSTGWPENDWNANQSSGDGTDDFGMNTSDGQFSDIDGAMPSADDNFGSPSWNEGMDSQSQNRPGESLSQGNGAELYSGEVENGNVILQE